MKNRKDISSRDLMQFTCDAVTGDGKENKEIFVANITKTAKDRLNKKFGLEVDEITTDTSSVRHAYRKPAHNLEPDDIIHAKDVINTSIDITPSGENQNNSVYIFKKDIDGEISFLVEARIKNKKLLIFNFYRKTKKRQRPDAAL